MRIGLRLKKDGRFFALNQKGDTVIGHGENCHVLLDDAGVAPQHARIRITNLGIEMDDLGARGGTLVNSYAISKHFLSRDDELRIGNAELKLELSEENAPAGGRCRRCGADTGGIAQAPVRPGSGSGVLCAACTNRPRTGSSRLRVIKLTSSAVPAIDADPTPLHSLETPTNRWKNAKVTEPFRVAAKLDPDASSEERMAGALDERLIPDFKSIGILGEGSQGRVYKLQHKQTGEIVAAKNLWNANARSLSRLAREIEALKRLKHPVIVGLFDVRSDVSSTLLLMEFVDGPSLSAILKKEGPLEPLRALRLAAKLADGLAFAAARKVVHRDIKPSNILVGAGDSPKLLDFGLVTFEDRNTRLTADDQWIGTPHYMSPEQMRAEPTDARTDIWGLGVTFYHAMTGRLPYDASQPGELFKKILNDPVDMAPLVARAGERVKPIFERMLAKKIEGRPDPAEVARELTRLALKP